MVFFSGFIVKFEDVLKSLLFRFVWSKTASFKSQLSKTALLRSASAKLTWLRLQWLNLAPFNFNLKKEENCTWQFEKLKDNKNGLQSWNCTPNILQSIKSTSLKMVYLTLALLKLQVSNSHSTKVMEDRSVCVKLQLVKVQLSYSAFLSGFTVKSILEKSSESIKVSIMEWNMGKGGEGNSKCIKKQKPYHCS